SLADHNEQATGILVSRVTSDVDALTRFADWGMFTWMVAPVVIVGVFVAMAVYSWQLALLSLVAFLPAVFVIRWVRHRMIAAHDAKRTAVGNLLGAYSETLTGAEVVRAYNAQDRMQERLDGVSEQRYRAGLRANIYMSGIFVVGDLIGAFMMATVLVVGVTQRDALGLSAGELVGLLAFTTLLHSPVAELGETINKAQEAVAGWRKVLNLLDRPIEDLDPETGLDAPEGALSIGAEAVGFAYRDSDPVLHDVNVTIPAGVRVAIVGETGSGKSTFARLLVRLADPTEGSILLGGVPMTELASDARHRAVRLVPQDGFLFDTTIRRNIGYGREGASDSDIEAAIDVLGLRSWVDGLPEGLDTPIGERGELLSVGERQLVSFARAAVADPGLLILDEATSSVDPQTDLALTRAIDRLSEGRTVVSIAHRMSTAEAADLVLVFDDGRLIEQGAHAELVRAGGRYAAMHAAWTNAAKTTNPGSGLT
ncbi:MAG: ABC transporter ATP-binding protein/permease, partial [Acidimicrobiia bacterium]|nr:ABC transporter ATP-binding protein/permease [Acidimicrobiia bacterium]